MRIEEDKKLHFWAGFAIASVIGFIINPLTGFIVSILIAIGKEVYDHYFGGTPDRQDIVATAIGGFAGTIVISLLYHVI